MNFIHQTTVSTQTSESNLTNTKTWCKNGITNMLFKTKANQSKNATTLVQILQGIPRASSILPSFGVTFTSLHMGPMRHEFYPGSSATLRITGNPAKYKGFGCVYIARVWVRLDLRSSPASDLRSKADSQGQILKGSPSGQKTHQRWGKKTHNYTPEN